ncbi:MAG TPA: hypothetical protein VGP05_24735 [Pseudonocardia sp.]|nr:hypothetical protein [Pseudonocardia sp.]
MQSRHARQALSATQSKVRTLPATPALPAVATLPATPALPAVATLPATPALPAVATPPATPALPVVATEPITATCSTPPGTGRAPGPSDPARSVRVVATG